MHKKKLFRVLIYIFFVFHFSGCSIFDSNDDDNEPSFSVIEDVGGNLDVAIANEEHDILIGVSYDSENRLEKSVFVNEEGEAASAWFTEDGMPERLIIGDNIIVFSNYTETHFDVLGISESGEIFIEREVEIPEELIVYKDTFVDSQGEKVFKKAISLDSNDINKLGWAWDGLICAGSVASVKATFGLTLPFAVSSCGSLGLRTAAEVTDSQEIEFAPTAWNLAWCTHSDFTACVGLGLDVLEDELQRSEEITENRREEIAQGTGSLKFGGIWRYRDIDGHFVMETIRAFDAIQNPDQNCYNLQIMNFVESDGNKFVYRRAEDGFEIEAEFELIEKDVLKAIRLNDGAQFYWDREYSLTASDFENNTCSFKMPVSRERDKDPGSLAGIE